MLSFDFILIKYLISGLQLLSWIQRKYQLLIIVSYIIYPYIWSFMYISVCQDYSNMLVLWAFREGENVYGKGEKYGSYLITIAFSIETMLRLFYYLYKIKILCFGCLFYFSCQTTSNLNENWFSNNFFKGERL